MENLPFEMVELIAQQLSPQDLARCSAVSHEWREIFNKDWLWKPHCDPELEETLQTTPCVASPAFVAPEVGKSTLSPITHWKLAFMRENHLWKNWKNKEITNKKNKITESVVVSVDFLTDNLVVVWCSNQINILDVSAMPATLVAKTDTSISIHIQGNHLCSVIGTTLLLVVNEYSVDIFYVDTINKSIKLKHNIHNNFMICNCDVKDLFLYMSNGEQKLVIFDINTGKTLKEEPCPDANQNQKVEICLINTSPTCDFVAVSVRVGTIDIDGNKYLKFYIYSPKEGKFLPGPVTDRLISCHDEVYVHLHGHWLALNYYKFTVYNFLTQEVNFTVTGKEGVGACVCYNRFVFWGEDEEHSYLKSFSPKDSTLATLDKKLLSDYKSYKEIDNKFMGVVVDGDIINMVSESVLKLSGQTVEKCDISVRYDCKINRSFTRMLSIEEDDFAEFEDREWYLSCLW